MFYIGIRRAYYLFALAGQAPSQFGIFAVHEKCFIK